MNGQPAEECLKSRIPENVIDSVDVVAGPLTELFELAKDKINEADEAVKLYCQQVEIPDLFLGRSKLYPVAKELRSEYGKAVSKLINRAESISDMVESDTYFTKQIEKVNARIRGSLTKYSRDEQKLIIKDLAHLCYIALPGSGNDNYTLTQSNDGILGIPSSAGERNLGTAHIFIDLLLDLGVGLRIERDRELIVNYKPTCKESLSDIEYNMITVVGGWRRLAERDGYSSSNLSNSIINKYCIQAYNKINNIKLITVKQGQIVHDSEVMGYIAKSSSLPDGSYSVIKTIPLSKSILLQVIPSA